MFAATLVRLAVAKVDCFRFEGGPAATPLDNPPDKSMLV